MNQIRILERKLLGKALAGKPDLSDFRFTSQPIPDPLIENTPKAILELLMERIWVI